MPLTQPSFLPIGLVPFSKIRDEIGAKLLGSALAGGNIVAIFFDPGGNFLPMMSHYWREQHGSTIMENGYIPSAVAWQIGIPNGGQDISIYFDAAQAEALSRAFGAHEPVTAPPDAAGKPKPMRDRDLEEAVAALKVETLAKRLTRAKAKEFLRQRFPGRRITDDNFRSIFRDVPTDTGRPKKADEEL